jgi:hypothetical protein
MLNFSILGLEFAIVNISKMSFSLDSKPHLGEGCCWFHWSPLTHRHLSLHAMASHCHWLMQCNFKKGFLNLRSYKQQAYNLSTLSFVFENLSSWTPNLKYIHTSSWNLKANWCYKATQLRKNQIEKYVTTHFMKYWKVWYSSLVFNFYCLNISIMGIDATM